MPRYLVRARETRVHTLYVEADDEEQAREIAADLDGQDSVSDTFDEWEVMDVSDDDAPAISQQHGETP